MREKIVFQRFKLILTEEKMIDKICESLNVSELPNQVKK